MSAVQTLAKPRRIKASHRRRRRIASGQSVQRYYDPQIGRFLSVDPVTAYGGDPRHFNRYSYAFNNPYKFTDPDGRNPLLLQRAVQLEFRAVYVVATYLGAGVLGGWIGNKIYDIATASESSEADANEPSPSLLDDKAEQHVLEGDREKESGGHRSGTGIPGKSEFPAEWSDEKILGEISDIATNPETEWSKPDSRGYVSGSGTSGGVDINVVYDTENGRIVTGYPTNTERNPRDE